MDSHERSKGDSELTEAATVARLEIVRAKLRAP